MTTDPTGRQTAALGAGYPNHYVLEEVPKNNNRI